MILLDVNVLVYAHRKDAARHDEYRAWLENALTGAQPYGLSDLVLSGFLRVVTHPRVFRDPTPVAEALAFVDAVRDRSNRVRVEPGPRHWDIFRELCRRAEARGNLVPDAYLAAMAIESGAEWITTDGDFRRFAGLRTRHPLE
ncbi:MAG: type II toxin-antitoxin system VapC family toxin [Gemmatimonadetes bacterium]|nr:type II toxin-antitoxin system VapC family toxin [Gemmatimonadota bacterium]